jgi:hypothetical protein
MAVHKATLGMPFYNMFGYDLRAPLWLDGDIFLEDVNILYDRVDPRLHLWRTPEVIHTTTHHNNQHYQKQYTNQDNKNRIALGPVYQPSQAVGCRIHKRMGRNPKLQPMLEEGEIIGHRPNPNSYMVCKPVQAHKQQTTISIHDLKPHTPTPDDPPLPLP